MKTGIIRDVEPLAAVRAEWSELAASIPAATPFQTPEWQLTWWRHFGSGELHTFVFRENGSLAAIVPCFLHEWNSRKQLTLIGSGISDYLDPLIASGATGAVVSQLARELNSDAGWEVVNWQDLSAGTPLARLQAESSVRAEILEDTVCTQLPISGSFKDYWEKRPYNLRRNVRRYRERGESQGEFQFKVTAAAGAECIDALIRLHGERWRRHGEPGMIEANHSAEFLRDVSREFASRNALKIFSLHCNSDICAVLLAFERGSRLYGYLTAFDPGYEKFGVGRILLFEVLRFAFDHSYTAWDFLRGDEPYKQWWGAKGIPKCRLVITRSG